MTDTAALSADVTAESIFAERENIQKRTAALDKLEAVFQNMNEDDLDAILEMADVFMRAAQLRAQKLNRGGRPGMPPGVPGRAPCGK